MACSSLYRDCKAGVILGTGKFLYTSLFLIDRDPLTGINACYFEHLDNVLKWTGPRDSTTKNIVINTEWGALGKVCSHNEFVFSYKILFFHVAWLFGFYSYDY